MNVTARPCDCPAPHASSRCLGERDGGEVTEESVGGNKHSRASSAGKRVVEEWVVVRGGGLGEGRKADSLHPRRRAP